MYVHWKLKRIGIMSAVKIGSLIFFAAGLAAGVLWAVIFMFFSSLVNYMMMNEQPPAFGFTALIFLPVMFAAFFTVLGAVLTFLFTLLFNIAAGLFGGLELEVNYTYVFKDK